MSPPAPSSAHLDRSKPPQAEPVHPFSFPPFHRYRLANGMVVVAARLPRVPLVSLELFTPASAQHDPPDGAGLATFTAALLDEGTARRSATEIAALVERLGGRLSTGAGWNASYVDVSVLAKDLEVGLGLLTEIVLEPSFPEEEIERLRQRRLGELLQGKNDAQVLATDAFNRAVYGDGIYGRRIVGDETSVASFDRSRVSAFHRLHNTAAGSCFTAIGDLDPEELFGRLQKAFANAPTHPPTPQPAVQPRERDGVEVHLVHRPR
ncbi:MAG: insulinase family protein, partial [Acidobacteria bacterium]|nr:insulinase family protein [Acidobacteriota bacterium]